jgi:nicotinate-nucleotide adenylyltransferase
MPTTAIFGGSFNPPHVGHVLAVTYILSVHPVDAVLVVPVYQHVFGKDLAPFDDRMEMCRRSMSWIPGVQISAIEKELGGESRTLHTVEALRQREPDRALRLVIGSDVLPDLPKWHRFDRISELAPAIVLGRAGHPHPDAPMSVLPEVSSTQIRASARDAKLADIAGLVPESVRAYIAEHGLYAP